MSLPIDDTLLEKHKTISNKIKAFEILNWMLYQPMMIDI